MKKQVFFVAMFLKGTYQEFNCFDELFRHVQLRFELVWKECPVASTNLRFMRFCSFS